MRPALSVILLSTLTGIGYGMLALLGVLHAAGMLPPDRAFRLAAFVLAFGAAGAGLIASVFHLGHPERAWLAFSQWRSSWLSREGIVSLLAFVPALPFAAACVLGQAHRAIWIAAGLAGALLAAATVYCTAMIYASLRPIHQWCNRWVPPSYLTLALVTSSLWLNAVMYAFGAGRPRFVAFALGTIAAAAAVKLGYWRFIDRTRHPATTASATGLGDFGRVRQVEGPHSEDNYLLREMGFRIARRHAEKLRRITAVTAFALPALLLPVCITHPGIGGAAGAIVAALSGSAGTLVERWLFFAEARHTVMLYYGAAGA